MVFIGGLGVLFSGCVMVVLYFIARAIVGANYPKF